MHVEIVLVFRWYLSKTAIKEHLYRQGGCTESLQGFPLQPGRPVLAMSPNFVFVQGHAVMSIECAWLPVFP